MRVAPPGHARLNACGLEAGHQRVGDSFADAFVVERHVVVGLGRGDGAVIGYDLDALGLGLLDQRGGSGGIHRVQHDGFHALGNHGVELLLLARCVAVGVLVEHFAGGAELLHLGLEAGAVVLLVAGGRLVGHQERDLGGGDGLGIQGGAAQDECGQGCKAGQIANFHVYLR